MNSIQRSLSIQGGPCAYARLRGRKTQMRAGHWQWRQTPRLMRTGVHFPAWSAKRPPTTLSRSVGDASQRNERLPIVLIGISRRRPTTGARPLVAMQLPQSSPRLRRGVAPRGTTPPGMATDPLAEPGAENRAGRHVLAPQARACGCRGEPGGPPHPHAASSVVAPVAVSDAATPTRSTTFDSCRQKRIRRHQATRDSIAAPRLHATADQPDVLHVRHDRRAQVGQKMLLAHMATLATLAASPTPFVFSSAATARRFQGVAVIAS